MVLSSKSSKKTTRRTSLSSSSKSSAKFDKKSDMRAILLPKLQKMTGDRDSVDRMTNEIVKDVFPLVDEGTMTSFLQSLFTDLADARVHYRKAVVNLLGLFVREKEVSKAVASKIVEAMIERFHDTEAVMAEQCADSFGIMIKSNLKKFGEAMVKSVSEGKQGAAHVQSAAGRCLYEAARKGGQVLDEKMIAGMFADLESVATSKNFAGAEDICQAMVAVIAHPNNTNRDENAAAFFTMFQGIGKEKEWKTRKAFVSATELLAKAMGGAARPYVDKVVPVLKDLRRDKMKPVREAAIDCDKTWNSLPEETPGYADDADEESAGESGGEEDMEALGERMRRAVVDSSPQPGVVEMQSSPLTPASVTSLSVPMQGPVGAQRLKPFKLSTDTSVTAFLEDIGMDQYADKFIAEGYDDIEVFSQITEDDLANLGIDKAGHRKKIFVSAQRIHFS